MIESSAALTTTSDSNETDSEHATTSTNHLLEKSLLHHSNHHSSSTAITNSSLSSSSMTLVHLPSLDYSSPETFGSSIKNDSVNSAATGEIVDDTVAENDIVKINEKKDQKSVIKSNENISELNANTMTSTTNSAIETSDNIENLTAPETTIVDKSDNYEDNTKIDKDTKDAVSNENVDKVNGQTTTKESSLELEVEVGVAADMFWDSVNSRAQVLAVPNSFKTNSKKSFRQF